MGNEKETSGKNEVDIWRDTPVRLLGKCDGKLFVHKVKTLICMQLTVHCTVVD